MILATLRVRALAFPGLTICFDAVATGVLVPALVKRGAIYLPADITPAGPSDPGREADEQMAAPSERAGGDTKSSSGRPSRGAFLKRLIFGRKIERFGAQERIGDFLVHISAISVA
jgi:hypothetical protein